MRSLSSKLLTGEEGVVEVARLQVWREIRPEERAVLNLGNFCSQHRNASVMEGRQISPFPGMFHEVGSRTWGELPL
jgi:hypothetical protein